MQAVGGTTTGYPTYKPPDFMQDVANTQQAIMTGVGVRLPADYCWTSPTAGGVAFEPIRPVEQAPADALPPQAPSVVKLTPSGGNAPGYTATTLLGSHFFSAGNIADVPNTSPVQSQITFANGGEVFLMQSEPCVRILPEPNAQDLTVLVQCFSYIGVVVRHATAVNTLQADYLLAAPTFN
jgi:hypothetical protein